jgi:hypothetical protein
MSGNNQKQRNVSSAVGLDADFASVRGATGLLDPGAVGAGKVWFDTTAGAVKVRDAANQSWATLVSSAARARHAVRVFSTTTFALTNAADAFPTFDSERFDTDNYHSGTSSRLTVPAGLDGLYLVVWHGYTTGSPGAGSNCGIRLNGVSGIAIGSLQNDTSLGAWHVSTIWPLVAGDYVEGKIRVQAISKTTIADPPASPEFSMTLLSL